MKSILPKNYFWLAISLMLLLLPNIYLTVHSYYFEGASAAKRLVFLILSGVLVSAPLAFLRPKIYSLLGIVFAIAAPFELANICLYHTTLSSGIILAIFNTSYGEATEFLKWILPLAAFSILLIICYLYVVLKKIPFQFLLSLRQKRIIAAAVFIAVFCIWARDLMISSNTHRRLSFSEALYDGTNNFNKKFSKIFPFSVLIQVSRAIETHYESVKYTNKLASFKFQAYKKDSSSTAEKYVLVIGESSRSSNYQLYGYKRSTNPELSKINNLEVFQKFAANANLTSLCLPLLLTRATPDSFSVSGKEKTFISAFKESGFKTFWISNQGIYTSNLARFSLDVDRIYNLNSSIDIKGNYDENIFPSLDSILKLNDKKQLIIINLMGSHFQYSFRYTKGYSIFKPELEGAFDYLSINPSNREKLLNTYDNSILYTDFILASIINKLKSINSASLMVYLSDHGENLYDSGGDVFGHGNNSPTKYEIQIPFLVWHSFQYDSLYPSKIEALQNNRHVRASSSNLFYTLLDGANIGYKGENISKSLFSNEFLEDSIRKILTPNMSVVEYDSK